MVFIFGKGLWIRFEHKDERSLQITDKEGQDPGKKVEDEKIIQLLCIDYKRISNILKSMFQVGHTRISRYPYPFGDDLDIRTHFQSSAF